MARSKTSSPLHKAFEIGIFLKGLDGAIEIVSALILLVVPTGAITRAVEVMTERELSRDPRDFIASHLLRMAEHLSTGGKLFAAIYLLSHGVVKVVLIWALHREKLWAYPAAIAVFAAFGVYQMYRFALTGSVAMLALTVLDTIVIVLTWIEYRQLKPGGHSDEGSRIHGAPSSAGYSRHP